MRTVGIPQALEKPLGFANRSVAALSCHGIADRTDGPFPRNGVKLSADLLTGSRAFASTTISVPDTASQLPHLDDSNTQSPIAFSGPITPTASELPSSIVAHLTEWRANLHTQENDFLARNVMRYALPTDETMQWGVPHLAQPYPKSSSSLVNNSQTHTRASSLRSSRQPSSVKWNASSMEYDNRETAPDADFSLVLDQNHCFPSTYRSHYKHNSYAPSAISLYPPSLAMSGTTRLSDDQSVRTGAIEPTTQHLPMLEEDDANAMYTEDETTPGENENNEPPPPTFPCAFWFLDCAYSHTSITDWKTHCLSHFRGNAPPRTASCPLCPFTSSGADAWDQRMHHVAHEHHMQGESLAESKGDFMLFKWLWKKRLISGAMLKELESDFEGRSTERFRTIVDSEGRASEGRREARELRRIP